MKPCLTRSRGTARLLAVVLLLAGCGAAAPSRVASAQPGLGGTTWQLVRFQGGDNIVLTPDDPAKYTLAFGADGIVTARIDCNRGRGTWTSPEPSQLALGPLALTRAMCPPGSLHDHIIRDWSFVRSYVIRDGHLFLALFADAGFTSSSRSPDEPAPASSCGGARRQIRLPILHAAG